MIVYTFDLLYIFTNLIQKKVGPQENLRFHRLEFYQGGAFGVGFSFHVSVVGRGMHIYLSLFSDVEWQHVWFLQREEGFAARESPSPPSYLCFAWNIFPDI